MTINPRRPFVLAAVGFGLGCLVGTISVKCYDLKSQGTSRLVFAQKAKCQKLRFDSNAGQIAGGEILATAYSQRLNSCIAEVLPDQKLNPRVYELRVIDLMTGAPLWGNICQSQSCEYSKQIGEMSKKFAEYQ